MLVVSARWSMRPQGGDQGQGRGRVVRRVAVWPGRPGQRLQQVVKIIAPGVHVPESTETALRFGTRSPVGVEILLAQGAAVGHERNQGVGVRAASRTRPGPPSAARRPMMIACDSGSPACRKDAVRTAEDLIALATAIAARDPGSSAAWVAGRACRTTPASPVPRPPATAAGPSAATGGGLRPGPPARRRWPVRSRTAPAGRRRSPRSGGRTGLAPSRAGHADEEVDAADLPGGGVVRWRSRRRRAR